MVNIYLIIFYLLPGTTCLNSSMSSQLKSSFHWSQSTSFYPGESKFSKTFEDRIYQATGMLPSNGGKFQVTSYPKGIGKGQFENSTAGQSKCVESFLKEPSPIFSTLSEILESEENSYFSQGPWWIFQLKNVPFGKSKYHWKRYMYGNHNVIRHESVLAVAGFPAFLLGYSLSKSIGKLTFWDFLGKFRLFCLCSFSCLCYTFIQGLGSCNVR